MTSKMYLPCRAGWGVSHTIAPSALSRVAYNRSSGTLIHQYARYKKFINQKNATRGTRTWDPELNSQVALPPEQTPIAENACLVYTSAFCAFVWTNSST